MSLNPLYTSKNARIKFKIGKKFEYFDLLVLWKEFKKTGTSPTVESMLGKPLTKLQKNRIKQKSIENKYDCIETTSSNIQPQKPLTLSELIDEDLYDNNNTINNDDNTTFNIPKQEQPLKNECKSYNEYMGLKDDNIDIYSDSDFSYGEEISDDEYTHNNTNNTIELEDFPMDLDNLNNLNINPNINSKDYVKYIENLVTEVDEILKSNARK